MIAPNFKYVATMNNGGTICIYEIMSAKLVSKLYDEMLTKPYTTHTVSRVIPNKGNLTGT